MGQGLKSSRFTTIPFLSAGTTSMHTDGSVSNITFSITGQVVVAKIDIVILNQNINPGGFGGIIGGLSNGVLFNITDSLGTIITEAPIPIRKNEDWLFYTGVGQIDTKLTAVGSDNFFIAEIDFIKKSTDVLFLEEDFSINLVIQDDLTPFSSMRAFAQGVA